MDYKAIFKGAAAGMMTGAVCYMISRSSVRQKKMLKKSTEKAIKAFGTAIDCFSSMIG